MTKTWFAIDGALEPIDYSGPTFFRFPLELAERVITDYSTPGDWVLDPFCGFGTTLVAAHRLGRHAVGFEKDAARGRFAAGRVVPPSRVLVDDARQAAQHALPRFGLLFSSPRTPRSAVGTTKASRRTTRIFDRSLAAWLIYCGRQRRSSSTCATCAKARASGWSPWRAAAILADVFRFDGEVVRCNTGHKPGAIPPPPPGARRT
jgi:hypothetical protein